MATLASYFGLGQQKHRSEVRKTRQFSVRIHNLISVYGLCRSLDDVRMNLEVLKNCATVLLLVSILLHGLDDKRIEHDAREIDNQGP